MTESKINKKIFLLECVAIVAHALALRKFEAITDEEFALLKQGIGELALLSEHDNLLADGDREKIILEYLSQKLPNLEKKLSLSDSYRASTPLRTRLYLISFFIDIFETSILFIKQLLDFTKKYTSHQSPDEKAPKETSHSLGIWALGYLEFFFENLKLLKNIYDLLEEFPKIDSDLSSQQQEFMGKLIGFPENTRSLPGSFEKGKLEKLFLYICLNIMQDLYRFFGDIAFFSRPEIGYMTPLKEVENFNEIFKQASDISAHLFQIPFIEPLSSYRVDNEHLIRNGIEKTLSSLKIGNQLMKDLKVDATATTRFSKKAQEHKQSSQEKPTLAKTDCEILAKEIEANQSWISQKRSHWEGAFNRLLN